MQLAPPPVHAAAVVVVGGGGGRGDGGVDSAHHDPDAPPLDGIEMGRALVAVATTVVVEASHAVTLAHSKTHFL